MTNEDKNLLLKDICARLPYGVKVSVSGDDFDNYQYPYLLIAISKFGQDILCKVYSPIYTPLGCRSIENVKPYLRPISSMTEKEREEIETFICDEWFINDSNATKVDSEGFIEFLSNYDCSGICPEFCGQYVDWLNEHHFDFRGLISKGLALEAPEDMYES